MKVLFVTPGCFDKGGISRYNRYQIILLRELYSSDNVKVISLLGPDENSFEDGFETSWHGSGNSLKDKLQLIWQASRLAIAWKPDIIWLAHVNLSGAGYFISKLCAAKTILNVYGLEIWSALSKDAAFGLRKVHYIISDCHNTAGYLTKNKIRAVHNIEIIWDCIDLNKFYPDDGIDLKQLAKYNIPDPISYFIILSLGRLSKPDAFYKGYDRLIKVFAKIVKNFPQARLVIAGRGNYREDLEKMVYDMNLKESVSFTGVINEDDLGTVYRSCHLFSLITESGEGKGEGIPLTPLEAMACGKPILVGNQDGSHEAIINEQNGFAMEPSRLDIHQQVIENYITDKALYNEHSKNAGNLAREYFSFEVFKQKHYRFLKRISSVKATIN